MRYREFIYVGEPVPNITEQEYTAFLLQFQKAILASLEKRELIDHSQYVRCADELEKEYERRNLL